MSLEGNRFGGGTFSDGEALSASKLNDLSAAAARGQQWHSTGDLVTQGTFGTVSLNGRALQSGVIYDFPFRVSAYVDGSTLKVSVRPGTANNRMPKMGGKYMDDTPKPELTMPAPHVPVGVYLKIKHTSPGFFPQEAEVILATEISDSDTEGYLMLASVAMTPVGQPVGVAGVYQHIYASQVVARVKPGSADAVWSFTSR